MPRASCRPARCIGWTASSRLATYDPPRRQAKKRCGALKARSSGPLQDQSFAVTGDHKPSSVDSHGRPWERGKHSSRTLVAERLVRPTRGHRASNPFDTPGLHQAITSTYAALLQVGFTVPRSLPSARWALTPPFHPYLAALARGAAVSFLWHSPRGHPHRALPGTLLCGARTFLPWRSQPKLRCHRRLPVLL